MSTCTKCKGHGVVLRGKVQPYIDTCPKCNGQGEVSGNAIGIIIICLLILIGYLCLK